jgi:hypothetical protein
VLENDIFDMGVLLYREYFLKIGKSSETICNLLVNSFEKSNGQLESKAFLLQRFIPLLNFEQAIKFLEAIERGVSDSSRGNILI